jgi:hypothetical protein
MAYLDTAGINVPDLWPQRMEVGIMKHWHAAVLFFCCAGLIFGCSARSARTPLVENHYLRVSLEEQAAGGSGDASAFAHPADIEKSRLRLFLSRLQYLEKPFMGFGETKKLPVFQTVELDRLVPALSEALAEAGPQERVRFISYNKGGGLILEKRRRTGGVVFVKKPDQLNLAFSYINYELKDEELKRSVPNKLYSDPLAIRKAETSLIAPAYAGHRVKENRKMPMWITAGLNEIGGSLSAPAVEARPERREAPGGPSEAGKAPAPEPAAQKPQAPLSIEEKEASPQPAGEAVDPWEAQKEEVREKLEYLKELHESELISTEEYEAEKKKLLERIR